MNPDMSKLENEFVVFTDYDKETNFGSYTSYYIPDSVLIIGRKKPQYATESEIIRIIDVIVDNMNERGYIRSESKDEADLGIQVSYIEDVSYFYDYTASHWWWGYPGYWSPGYWGGYWGDWYYPYPVRYSYAVGSLLTEMVDLKEKSSENNRLKVLWTGYMTALVSVSGNINVSRAITAVNQSFMQSSYIAK
jgi:hypothetical protein